jgi:hypothetical protein
MIPLGPPAPLTSPIWRTATVAVPASSPHRQPDQRHVRAGEVLAAALVDVDEPAAAPLPPDA